jgi:hypothetical protein
MLRAITDDGQIAECEVPLDFRRDGMFASVLLDALIKARLYDAYLSLEHFVNPEGPPLPPQLQQALQ